MDSVKITNTPQPPWPFPAKPVMTPTGLTSSQPHLPEHDQENYCFIRKGRVCSYMVVRSEFSATL